MEAIIVKLLARLPILAAAVLLLLLARATPVEAMPCFTDLAYCYQDAAGVDSFWLRWAAGLDCELGFLSCAREDVLGF
jgi:hypothetical protein